ncbi:MAG: polysulfide reductase NrfD, partial [Gemmatimonadota bacterium]|nr:polysulfide reductase NrfD [Gemmatimonadota bacterium]
AILTAVYTAFLFGQAKARDMWQNPLLPVHFLVQAFMAGAGAVVLAVLVLPTATGPLGAGAMFAALRFFAMGSAAHALMILGEILMPPPTAHARLAEREMTHGRFRGWFRVGLLGALLGAAAPWLGWIVVPIGLVALLAYEHAYVQAGQSVALS